MSGRLLNLAEVADRLGVSRTTCWRLISNGEIPSVRITSTLRRVDPADLESWIASRRETPGAATVLPLAKRGGA